MRQNLLGKCVWKTFMPFLIKEKQEVMGGDISENKPLSGPQILYLYNFGDYTNIKISCHIIEMPVGIIEVGMSKPLENFYMSLFEPNS